MFRDFRSKTERNFNSVLDKLREAIFLHSEYFEYDRGVTLDRKRLRILITDATGITYRQGVYALIELLQARRILIPNPSFEEHQFESNYSRYILNIGNIFDLGLDPRPELIEAIQKIKSQKKSVRDTQSQLSDYKPNDSVSGSKGKKESPALILSSESPQ